MPDKPLSWYLRKASDEMRYALVDDRNHQLTERKFKGAIEDLMMQEINRLEGLALTIERDEDSDPPCGQYGFMAGRP